MQNTTPVVTLCHILLNTVDSGTQYFAVPNEINCESAIKIPENALWTALENTEKNWIEIYPVKDDEPATLRAFLELGYEVALGKQYPLPAWIIADIENCRWFAEIDDE